MSDYGLLAAIRHHLLQETRELIPDQRIHLTLMPETKFPCVLLELNEIWSGPAYLNTGTVAKITFQLSIFNKDKTTQSSLLLSGHMLQVLNGITINTQENCIGILKSLSIRTVSPENGYPAKVEQTYEALIRRISE